MPIAAKMINTPTHVGRISKATIPRTTPPMRNFIRFDISDTLRPAAPHLLVSSLRDHGRIKSVEPARLPVPPWWHRLNSATERDRPTSRSSHGNEAACRTVRAVSVTVYGNIVDVGLEHAAAVGGWRQLGEPDKHVTT